MPKTVNAGAAVQRSLVRRKLRRLLQIHGYKPTNAYSRGWSDCCQALDAWLYGEPGRTRKPGGLGR